MPAVDHDKCGMGPNFHVVRVSSQLSEFPGLQYECIFKPKVRFSAFFVIFEFLIKAEYSPFYLSIVT
jgi:hypothetical protein